MVVVKVVQVVVRSISKRTHTSFTTVTSIVWVIVDLVIVLLLLPPTMATTVMSDFALLWVRAAFEWFPLFAQGVPSVTSRGRRIPSRSTHLRRASLRAMSRSLQFRFSAHGSRTVETRTKQLYDDVDETDDSAHDNELEIKAIVTQCDRECVFFFLRDFSVFTVET